MVLMTWDLASQHLCKLKNGLKVLWKLRKHKRLQKTSHLWPISQSEQVKRGTKSYRSYINCNYFQNVVNLSINICNSFNYRHLNKFNSSRVVNLSITICNFSTMNTLTNSNV
jgi:hypothetical protein